MEKDIKNSNAESIDENADDSNYELSQDSIASKKIRFFNSLIDLMAISLISYLTGMNEYILYPICFFLYYLIFESAFGVTLGKIITKTKVSDVFGYKPSFFSIFIRSLTRLIPFEALSFLSTNGRGWHDYFSGTYVSYK